MWLNCDKIEDMVMETIEVKGRKKRLVKSRLTTIAEQGDRTFDIEFWQELTDEQRLKAVWDMTVFNWEVKGKNPDELRLQRSITNFRRL